MAAQQNTVIINVEVDAGKAAQNLASVKQGIAQLKKEQKEYEKQVRSGVAVSAEQTQKYAENAAQLKELTTAEKMYTNQISYAAQGNKVLAGSLTEMGALLTQLKNEYRSLGEAQREGAEGQQLLKRIQDLDQEMKDADASMGDYQRNVGNYQSALNGLGGRALQVGQMFQGGFKNGLQAAGQAVKNFGKMLLTTPVGWVTAAVAALIGVFKQLQAAFKRNDDAGTALAVALSKLQPVATFVMKIFDGLAIGVAKFVGFVGDAITLLAKLSPKFRENQKAAEDLVVAEDELEEKQRQFTTTQAERNEEIAKLNKQARSDEKLTAKEREEIYKQMDELSRQNMEDAVKLAQEEYDNLVEHNKQKRKLSDDDKKKEREYYNALIEARTNYYNETTRIGQREMSARKEQAAAEEAERQARIQKWREYQQARKEAAKTELDELRKLEDMTIAAITDTTQQALKQTETEYTRQIQDLQTRLNTEKNLTTATREAINQQIIMLEAELQRKLTEIRNAASEEERQRLIKEAEDNYNAQLSFAQENEELIKSQMTNAFNDLQIKLNESLAKAGENARLQSEAQLTYAQSYLQQLNDMNDEQAVAMFGNFQNYTLAVQEAEKAVMDAQRSSQEALQSQVNEVGQTMQAVTGSLSSLFEAAAEDSESYEKFKKAMAIVDAMISMATTIAAATTASTEGDPYTMAIRIAANVAAVTAQFAAVIKAIKAATIPSAGSFAEGGVVEGTSYTGDRMTAHVNSGEMILTRQMQLEMLKLLANGVPSSAFNYNRMKEAFTEALQEQKAPVLVYSEFEDFNNRRKKIQAITQL